MHPLVIFLDGADMSLLIRGTLKSLGGHRMLYYGHINNLLLTTVLLRAHLYLRVLFLDDGCGTCTVVS